MDRNSTTGLILILLIFLAWSYYNQHQRGLYEEQQKELQGSTVAEDSQTKEDTESISSPVTPESTGITAESELQDTSLLIADYGKFAPFRNGEEQVITVETEKLFIDFSNKGGYISKVVLKDYFTYNNEPLVLFENSSSDFNIEFANTGSNNFISSKDLYFASSDVSTQILEDNSKEITFTIDLGEGKSYSHVYTVYGSDYKVDFKIKMNDFDKIIPRNTSYLTLDWSQKLPRQENNVDDERMNAAVYFQHFDGEVNNLSYRKDEEKVEKTQINWISFKQKFFNTTLIAEKPFDSGSKLSQTTPDSDLAVKDLNSKLIINYSGDKSFEYPMTIYAGPNQFYALKRLKIGLHNILPLGGSMLGWVNRGIIIPIFTFLNKYISNYGIIIFLLVVIIKLMLTPLTYKSLMSMVKMKVLRPELDELREKCGKDQQKFAQQQMALYRKAGVNPMGGCLPMLFQMPILFAMYRFFPSSIELRQEAFLWAKDLSTYDSIASLPFSIPGYGAHVSLFTIFMAITSFAYTRMNAQAQPSMDSSNPMAAQMKIFQYIMPFMLLFIFNSFSAAMSYYYLVYNLLSMAQQYAVQKWFIDEDKIHQQIQENKKKPKSASKWQQKLDEMMKQQQEMQKRKGK